MRDEVADFYDAHPYPPAVDDIVAYRRSWDDRRRRIESLLVWPAEQSRDDRSILVAGCGTSQAAHYAVRWPRTRVVGIDVSATSLAFEERLKRAHGLDNLELRRMPIERAPDLGETFQHIVCTGVLHHLADPDAGLRALRDVLAPDGTVHVMVYAPYGRRGIYMLQAYCRNLGISSTEPEIRDLAKTLEALPSHHPLASLRNSPDFRSAAGLADALLHPRDRSYSVPQLMRFLERAGLTFGRWLRQAPYLPSCGAVSQTPHRARLEALPAYEQYAAIELFRGTMVRHSFTAYRSDRPPANTIDFDGDGWREYVPFRMPNTVTLKENLPPGAAAVLINRNHTYTDLYLPINALEARMLSAIDGRLTIEQICGAGDARPARAFFRQLWQWDQVVFARPQR